MHVRKSGYEEEILKLQPEYEAIKHRFDYYDRLSLFNVTAERIRLESVTAGTHVLMNMHDNVILPFCEVMYITV